MPDHRPDQRPDPSRLNPPPDSSSLSTIGFEDLYSSKRRTTRVFWVGSISLLLALPWFGVPAWAISAIGVTVLVVLFRRSHDQAETLLDQMEYSRSQSSREVASWKADWKRLESQSRLGASALLQLIDGVVVLSADLSILLINPSAIKLLGMPQRDELVGRRFDEIIRHPSMIKSIRAAINERHAQENVIELQLSGGVRPIRVRADLINDEEPFKIQLSLRDETEVKQLEDMRREFVANVSHELKTPLAAIKGYAETVELAVGDDPDMAIHFMNQIMSQCHRLERLISDMMQLARAQSGRALMNLSSVSMRDIVCESIRTYEPVAVAGGLTLNLHTIESNAKIMADPEAALTICNNLIGNAIRYTPRGGEVDVSLQRGDGIWTLIVQDTGVGIAEQDQTKIFERFYRASRNAEMATSSTGLGLAIVKNLTAGLDGQVSVQSKPGEGSTFRVDLPAVDGIGSPLPVIGNTAATIEVNV